MQRTKIILFHKIKFYSKSLQKSMRLSRTPITLLAVLNLLKALYAISQHDLNKMIHLTPNQTFLFIQRHSSTISTDHAGTLDTSHVEQFFVKFSLFFVDLSLDVPFYLTRDYLSQRMRKKTADTRFLSLSYKDFIYPLMNTLISHTHIIKFKCVNKPHLHDAIEELKRLVRSRVDKNVIKTMLASHFSSPSALSDTSIESLSPNDIDTVNSEFTSEFASTNNGYYTQNGKMTVKFKLKDESKLNLFGSFIELGIELNLDTLNGKENVLKIERVHFRNIKKNWVLITTDKNNKDNNLVNTIKGIVKEKKININEDYFKEPLEHYVNVITIKTNEGVERAMRYKKRKVKEEIKQQDWENKYLGDYNENKIEMGESENNLEVNLADNPFERK